MKTNLIYTLQQVFEQLIEHPVSVWRNLDKNSFEVIINDGEYPISLSKQPIIDISYVEKAIERCDHKNYLRD